MKNHKHILHVYLMTFFRVMQISTAIIPSAQQYKTLSDATLLLSLLTQILFLFIYLFLFAVTFDYYLFS